MLLPVLLYSVPMSKSKRTISFHAAYKISRAIPKIIDAGWLINGSWEPLPELRDSLAKSLELSADAVTEYAKSIRKYEKDEESDD